MHRVFSIALALSLFRPGNAQTATLIAPNTGVEIELLEPLSSQAMHNGQLVAFKVVRPVVVDGVTVIEAGTPVSGEVKAVQASGKWQKSGALDLILKPLRLNDGTVVHLDFQRPTIRSAKGGDAPALIAAPVIIDFFPLIPLVAIGSVRSGKPYEVRAGERYLVHVVSTESRDAAGASAAAKGKTTAPVSPK